MNTKTTWIAALACSTAAATLWSGQFGIEGATGSVERTLRQESPLSQFLGFGHHPDAEQRQYELDEQRRQDFIKTCMNTASFAYWPVGADILESGGKNNENYRRALPERAARDYSNALSGRTQDEQGMTAAELAKYDKDGNGMIGYEERATRGCLGRSEHAVKGVFTVRAVLSGELTALEDSVAAMPSVRAADSVWVSCLNEAGFVGVTVDEVSESLVKDVMATSTPQAEVQRTVESCNLAKASTFSAATVEAETEFYEQHKNVIARYAIRA